MISKKIARISKNNDLTGPQIAVLDALSNDMQWTSRELKDFLAHDYVERTLWDAAKQLREYGLIERKIDHKVSARRRGHPEYTHSITVKGHEDLKDFRKRNPDKYPHKIVQGVDLHESAKGEMIIGTSDGHDIDTNLIYKAIDRVLLEAASKGCTQARFTLSVNAKISPKIAKSVRRMRLLCTSVKEEREMFIHMMREKFIGWNGGKPLLPQWVVNFIWTNYPLWKTVYPRTSRFRERAKAGESLPRFWRLGYSKEVLKGIRKLLVALEKRLESEPSATYRVEHGWGLGGLRLSLSDLEVLGFEPVRLKDLKAKLFLDEKDVVEWWMRASENRESDTYNLCLETFLGEPLIERARTTQPDLFAVIPPRGVWNPTSLAVGLKKFETAERDIYTYEKMSELLGALNYPSRQFSRFPTEPMGASDMVWFEAIGSLGGTPIRKKEDTEYAIRFNFLRVIRLLVKVRYAAKGGGVLEKTRNISDFLRFLFRVPYYTERDIFQKTEDTAEEPLDKYYSELQTEDKAKEPDEEESEIRPVSPELLPMWAHDMGHPLPHHTYYYKGEKLMVKCPNIGADVDLTKGTCGCEPHNYLSKKIPHHAVKDVIRSRFSWHFPSCPFCKRGKGLGIELTRPNLNQRKYAKPFVCPNCKETIPEDLADLREKFIDYQYRRLRKYDSEEKARAKAKQCLDRDEEGNPPSEEENLRSMSVEELDAIIKRERTVNGHLEKLIVQLRRAKVDEFDDIYDALGFKKMLLEDMKVRKERKEITEEQMKKFKKYYKDNHFLNIWKTYYTPMQEITKGNQNQLKLDDIRTTRLEVERFIVNLKKEEEEEEEQVRRQFAIRLGHHKSRDLAGRVGV